MTYCEVSDTGIDKFPPGYWHWHAGKMREVATREALTMAWHKPTGNPRGLDWLVRVAERLVVPKRRGNACGGKEP